jgi:hypothetical protein
MHAGVPRAYGFITMSHQNYTSCKTAVRKRVKYVLTYSSAVYKESKEQYPVISFCRISKYLLAIFTLLQNTKQILSIQHDRQNEIKSGHNKDTA